MPLFLPQLISSRDIWLVSHRAEKFTTIQRSIRVASRNLCKRWQKGLKQLNKVCKYIRQKQLMIIYFTYQDNTLLLKFQRPLRGIQSSLLPTFNCELNRKYIQCTIIIVWIKKETLLIFLFLSQKEGGDIFTFGISRIRPSTCVSCFPIDIPHAASTGSSSYE